MSEARAEVDRGERFAFGRNWQRFLGVVSEEHVEQAIRGIRELLPAALEGKRFLDVGSGSGLSSLAARRLGARVHSFDFDPESVAATRALRERFCPDDEDWTVEQGSALDADYLRGLGRFDVVYSWGVLHHTGDLARALENVTIPLAPGGYLFIALYNDLGFQSRVWRRVKQAYCSGPVGRGLVSAIFMPYFASYWVLRSVVRRENTFRAYHRDRGMSVVHDWKDWLGGLPYEVAKVEDVFHLYTRKGFTLVDLRTDNGIGNNQLVFRAPDSLSADG